MADQSQQQPTNAPGCWSAAGERAEAREMARRLEWFLDDARLLSARDRTMIADTAAKLREHGNG